MYLQKKKKENFHEDYNYNICISKMYEIVFKMVKEMKVKVK